MSNIYVFPLSLFGKWKQEARALKRDTGIPHHAALEQVAKAKGFASWHHVHNEAKANLLTERAYRSGLVVAYDIKDAMDNWRPSSRFTEDYRVASFCDNDLFNWYKQSDEEENGAPPEIDAEYREEYANWSSNVAFFRYGEKELPETERDVLRLLNEHCFFAPLFIWYRGKFLDPWRDLAVDGVLDMS